MSTKTRALAPIVAASALVFAPAGCDTTALDDEPAARVQPITDVLHTDVERQSIGNCWLYAQASWVESMALAANPDEPLDVSQSYWTYWHWYGQITGSFFLDEISTGGHQFTSHAIVRDRGLMRELDFVPADDDGEMSSRQASALSRINTALAEGGELSSSQARADGERVRRVLDDAWQLSDDVRAQLDTAFGADGAATLRRGGSVSGTHIIDPADLIVAYTDRTSGQTERVEASLVQAISEWSDVRYPFFTGGRRDFLRRVQRALHDRQPVVLTWNVDFNALDNVDDERKGSFNLKTLEEAGGPGRQGGHMTVLEDYAALLADGELLEAGVTLDPNDPGDADKLARALDDDTAITLLRTKNSWGAQRPDREFAPGFPGYHDLWMDYMNGPIAWCPGDDHGGDRGDCDDETTPLRTVMLPPGY